MGQYTKEMNRAYRKERDQKAAELKKENRERMEREAAPRVWLADGGRETDFQREWPKLRDKGRRRRVVDADRRAREEMQAHGPSCILEGKSYDSTNHRRSAAPREPRAV